MFEKILLPLDGSELAEVTLPYGVELASRLGSEVILFHVCSPEHKEFYRMHKMYLDDAADRVRHEIMRSRPKGGEVKVKSETLLGEPVETICDYVTKNNIGLMVMASSGASGIQMWRLGSVTDKVFRTVSIPAMVIRAGTSRRGEGKRRLINRILLPLDGSDASKLALPVAEELALWLKARITLFQMAHRVFPLYDASGLEAGYGVNYARLDAAAENSARTYLIGVEKDLRQTGIAVTHSVAVGTDPANEIIELGKKVDADLVVMSTHGRSPVRRWVFGSVAEKVLREGDIPLLLVRQVAG